MSSLVTLGDRFGSISVSFPVGEAISNDVTIQHIKLEALEQLRKRCTSNPTGIPSSGILRDITRRDAECFVLFHKQSNTWLKDEHLSIRQSLLNGMGGEVHVALLPMNLMPLPGMEVHISATKNKLSDLSQREYTAYLIDVTFEDMKWQAVRRFKEFHNLHSVLKSKYPTLELPKLPHKHIFTPREGEFVDRRRQHLEQYLRELVVHPHLSNDVHLMSFMGVVSTSRDPELSQNIKTVLHVTTLHESVNYGDILLFSCKFGASVLQRKVRSPVAAHYRTARPNRFVLIVYWL